MSRSRPPTAGRRDTNERAIVEALRKIGCKVYRLDAPADLLVGYGTGWILFEVKRPGKEFDLTPNEQKVHDDPGGPYWIVTDRVQAVNKIQELKGA